MECYCYLRNVQDLLADGKTPYERQFGEPFEGPIIPFQAMVEYHPSSPKDQANIHHFGKKVLPGIFLTSDIFHRRMKAKEVLISQKDDELKFPTADGAAKLSGKDCKGTTCKERRSSVEKFKANREYRQNQHRTLKPVPTSGRSKETSSIVITMNLEFNYVPKEETYICSTKTH